MKTETEIKERNYKTVKKEYQLVVVGGGLAGISSAVSAARRGVKTCLINNRPVLGGNASTEVGININGACYNSKYSCSVYSRETGIIEEIKQLIYRYDGYSDEKGAGLDAALYDIVYKEKNIDLYLNTQAVEVFTENEKIKSITAIGLFNETVYEIKGELFVDASGDGFLGYRAGALYMTGSESRSEFGESLAPEKRKPVTNGSTIMFHTVDTGKEEIFRKPSFAYDIKDLSFFNSLGGKHRTFYKGKDGLFHGFWWVEYGGDLSTIYDAEEITAELKKIVYGIWDYIKNSGEFQGVETHKLVKVTPFAGKRESRRFIGDYILTQNDVKNKTDFNDGVYVAGWPMDVHADKGIYDEDFATRWNYVEGMYNAPYRTLYSANIKNMFMAGRNTSCTRVANGSTRVMATCCAAGQAVGTAASLCVKYGVLPRDIYTDKIEELKRELFKDDQTISGYKEESDLKNVKIESTECAKLVNHPTENTVDLKKSRILALPCVSGVGKVTLFVNNDGEDTAISYEILTGERSENYLPLRSEKTGEITLTNGFDGEIKIDTENIIGKDGKVYLYLKGNENVKLYCGAEEVTGAPSFTVWERTPDESDPRKYVLTRTYENIAFNVENEQNVYGAENLLSGYFRPYKTPNICLLKKENAFIKISFEKKFVKEIKLLFNTDLAEDIIYNQCKKTVCDYDLITESDKGTKTYSVTDNFDRVSAVKIGEEIKSITIKPKKNYGSRYYEIFGIKVY